MIYCNSFARDYSAIITRTEVVPFIFHLILIHHKHQQLQNHSDVAAALDGSHRNKNLAVDHTEALAESYCAVSLKLQHLKKIIDKEFDGITRDLLKAHANVTSNTPCFAFSQQLTDTMSLQSGFSYNYNVAPHLYNFIQ